MSQLPNADIRDNVPAILESPALYRDASSRPAYEVKFLLTESQAIELQNRLQPRLALDPHADPANGNSYLVTSVYFDTPAFDVYHRSKGYRRSKFRIRRYGASCSTFVERKMKARQQVRKRRTPTPLPELDALVNAPPPHWPGLWFMEQVNNRFLKPVCRVTYRRVALIGACHDGPIRVTFDRMAQGLRSTCVMPDLVLEGQPLLGDEVITEFKFLGTMPAIFKSTVEEMQLAPQSISKFRRCVERTGLVEPGVPGNA